MLTKKDLKIKYKNLDRGEKLLVGQAIIKVNLGVAGPKDQKLVAGFLKGSRFIAKAHQLDELIEFIHDDTNAGEDDTPGRVAGIPEEITGKEFDAYTEDMVATESDLGNTIKKKN